MCRVGISRFPWLGHYIWYQSQLLLCHGVRTGQMRGHGVHDAWIHVWSGYGTCVDTGRTDVARKVVPELVCTCGELTQFSMRTSSP